MTYDNINPSHYHGSRQYEPIDVIEDWQLNYNLGNALKYISRNGRKPGEVPVDGLKKAIWYLEREIKALTQPHGPALYDEVCTYEERTYQDRYVEDSIEWLGPADQWLKYDYNPYKPSNNIVLGDK